LLFRNFVFVVAFVVSACAPSSDRTPDPGLPGTVVLFAPSMTEVACALGFGNRIVAITDYDRWPAEILDRPRIGGALDPDLERLAVLRPDLLVLQGENQRLRQFAGDTGVRIADVKMDDDLRSILDGVLRLDDLLGGPESSAGERLVARIRTGLDSVAAAAAPERPEVLLVLSRSPHALGGIFSAGSETFFHDLLGIAGAENWAASRGTGYFEVPLDVLAADPPDLVLEYGDAIEGDDADRARVWSSLPGPPIPVRAVHYDGLMIPGARLVESASALARALSEAR
jgi:iron complex transport system substrate-binding protein